MNTICFVLQYLQLIILALFIEKCESVAVELGNEVATLDMVNCKKCTVFVKEKASLIQVDHCEEPKLILFNPCVAAKPRIMSSHATNFAIDVQKENHEESDWKNIMVPYQLQTEIDPENFIANNTLIQL